MTLLEKAKGMLGFRTRPHKEDAISVDVSVALQRNERASENARRALEELKMRDTLAHLAGKMK